MNKLFALMFVAFAVVACGESNLVPLRDIEFVEEWQPDETVAATAPATQATTQADTQSATTEPASQPATQPGGGGRLVKRRIDPNQTTRFVYRATYENVYDQARLILNRFNFRLDRQDFRLGVLTTQPLLSSHIIEPWRPDNANANNAIENTLHDQRRSVRITISKAPKPDFYEIAVQVIVERATNPTEGLGGPIFVEGSGFGRNALTLRSDYITSETTGPRWTVIGRDTQLERKLLDALFERI